MWIRPSQETSKNITLLFEDQYFDCILALGVLEHLTAPGKVLKECKRLLNPNGKMIVRIPNAQHYEIILRLMKGDWFPRQSGILDATHLHFYTKETIQFLFETHGFEVIAIHRNYYNLYVYLSTSKLVSKFQKGLAIMAQRPWFIRIIDRYFLKNFFAYQLIVVAKSA